MNGSRRGYASIRVSLIAVVVGALLAGAVSLSAALSAKPRSVADNGPLGPNLVVATTGSRRVDPAMIGAPATVAAPSTTTVIPTTTTVAPTTTAPTTTITTATTTVIPTTARTTVAPPSPTAPSTTTAPTPTTAPGQVAQLLAMVNSAREDAGCDDLAEDPRLDSAARQHSTDMAVNHYFSHTTPGGETFDQRETAAGYPSPGGENIAMGQTSAQAVMRAWMRSEGHRENILNCDFTAIGIGLDTRGWYWTQDFGR